MCIRDSLYAPVGLFLVTATFHGALALTAFLRMKVRPVRIDGRIRFRAMNAEKAISPGTVALDPRSAETQEDLPRTSATEASLKPEAPKAETPKGEVEILTPEIIEPVVAVEVADEDDNKSDDVQKRT